MCTLEPIGLRFSAALIADTVLGNTAQWENIGGQGGVRV